MRPSVAKITPAQKENVARADCKISSGLPREGGNVVASSPNPRRKTLGTFGTRQKMPFPAGKFFQGGKIRCRKDSYTISKYAIFGLETAAT
jgi:hypothetical protein